MFTLMVLMALITTMMTGPLMRRIYPDRVLERERAAAEAAEQAELGEPDTYTVLVTVPEEPAAARRTALLAGELVGHEQPARVVLCRLLPAEPELEVASGLGAELAVLATVGDELRRLAAELDATGTPGSVVARFSADPAADLAALAARVDADVVLLAEDAPAAVEPGSELGAPDAAPVPSATGAQLLALDAVPEVTVVVAGAGAERGGSRVGVVVDGAAGGRAALRVGAQLALRSATGLAVAPAEAKRARRSSAPAADALVRRGVPAEAVDRATADGAGLLVLPVDLPVPAAGGAVLRVRPAAADVDDDLDQVVDRIVVRSTTGSTTGRDVPAVEG